MCICGLSSRFSGLFFLGVPGFLPTLMGFLPGCAGLSSHFDGLPLYRALKKKKKKATAIEIGVKKKTLDARLVLCLCVQVNPNKICMALPSLNTSFLGAEGI